MKKKDPTIQDIENQYYQDTLALRLQLVGEEPPVPFLATTPLLLRKKTDFPSFDCS